MASAIGSGFGDALIERVGPARQAASVFAPSPMGRNSIREVDVRGFRPLGIGGAASPEDDVEQMRRAEDMWRTHPIYRRMIRTVSNFVCGSGPVKLKGGREDVAQFLQRCMDDPANWFFSRPRHEYTRWRIYGKGFYLLQPRADGTTRMHWRHPFTFEGFRWLDDNDALLHKVTLANTRPFIEQRYKVVTTPFGLRSVPCDEPTDFSQGAPYCEGKSGTHIVTALRDKADSSRASWDAKQLGTTWTQLIDGTAFVLRANTEVNSWGEPDYIEVFDDLNTNRAMWKDFANRAWSIYDKVFKYFYRGAKTPDLERMINEGWEPQDGETLFIPFNNVKGDSADLDVVSANVGAYEAGNFFTTSDNRITMTTGLPPTWFSKPEERVLAGIEQTSPALMQLQGEQEDWLKEQTLCLRAFEDTGRMYGAIPCDAPRWEWELERADLTPEDRAKTIADAKGIVEAAGAAVRDGLMDERAARVWVRDQLDILGLFTRENYMASIGADPEGPIPDVDPPADPLAQALGRPGAQAAQQTFSQVLQTDPVGAASLIKGFRTFDPEPGVVPPNGNGHK